MYKDPRLLPAGDKALVVEFGNEITPEINIHIRSFAAILNDKRIPGVREVVPTYRSVLVCFDPLEIDPEELEKRLVQLLGNLGRLKPPKPFVTIIPVCYGGEYGPDLSSVCKHTGLSEKELIRIHTGTDYLIYMLGFTPGFPYLGGMDRRIATPRLKTPRTKIPAGSVGIADKQTGIYPIDSPGGWQLIGRTPLKLYDPFRDPPVLLSAGNYVRFKAITPAEYEKIAAQVAVGSYQVQVELLQEGESK